MLELQSIADFIARDSPTNAEKVVGRILASTRRLREFPQSGRKIPEASDESVRQVVARNYRVFYRLEKDAVVVIGERHGAVELKFEDFPA